MKLYREYDEDELRKIQLDEMVVLKKIIELCEKHDIRYFAIGGTLLGAVRHEGFIPWDDDIDLGMIREDYERFLLIPESEYEGFGFYAPEKNPGGFYSFVPKFYKKDTKFIPPITYANNDFSMGIFVEIFPFDDIPENDEEFARKIKRADAIKTNYLCTTCTKFISFEKGFVGVIKNIAKRLLRWKLLLTGNDMNKLAKEYCDLMRGDGTTPQCTEFADTPFRFNRCDLLKVIPMKFEDITIMAPEGYKNMLESYYGPDYMIPAKPEERWNAVPSYIQFIDGTIIDYEKENRK